MAVVKKKELKKATAKTEAKVDWRTPEFAEILLDAIAGGMTLKEVCATNDLPKTSVLRWISTEYLDQYACALRARADMQAEEIIEIADKKYTTNEELIAAKMRIDARKWLMSKMAPKKYGDKVELDHGVTEELKEIVVKYVK